LSRERWQSRRRALVSAALLLVVADFQQGCGHGCDDTTRVGLILKVRDGATSRDICDANVTTVTRNGPEGLSVSVVGETCEYSGLVGQRGTFTLQVTAPGYVERDIMVTIPDDDCSRPITQFREVTLDPA
jgi:hypothetical protein